MTTITDIDYICAAPCTCEADAPEGFRFGGGMRCPRHGEAGSEILHLRAEVQAHRERAQLDRAELERQITGALKSAIDAHGPIRRSGAGSAAKRIANQIEARRTEKSAMNSTAPSAH